MPALGFSPRGVEDSVRNLNTLAGRYNRAPRGEAHRQASVEPQTTFRFFPTRAGPLSPGKQAHPWQAEVYVRPRPKEVS